MKNKVAILENIIPNKDDLFTFTKEMEALGDEHDLESYFSFGSEGEDSIGYEMSIEGSYEEILDFIKIIENDLPFMNILLVDVVSIDGGYRAVIEGRIFFNE